MVTYGFEKLNMNKVWLGVEQREVPVACAHMKRPGLRMKACCGRSSTETLGTSNAIRMSRSSARIVRGTNVQLVAQEK